MSVKKKRENNVHDEQDKILGQFLRQLDIPT